MDDVPISLLPFELTIASELQARRKDSLFRTFRTLPESVSDFSTNDYLGLACHPELIAFARDAISHHGVGHKGSRLVCGHQEDMSHLENALANWKQTEAALLMNSGFQANLSAIPVLAGRQDLLLSDKLNHASLNEGCRLSRAQWKRYRHLDMTHLEALLGKYRNHYHHVWLVTDSLFSMDGDWVDLRALLLLAEKYDAMVYLDDAHGTGVFGQERGSGLAEWMAASQSRRLLQMGTFSKALGSYGAFFCGSTLLIQQLTQHHQGLIYSTALPPAVMAANLASLALIQREPQHRESLWKRIHQVHRLIETYGLERWIGKPLSFTSPIVPVWIGSNNDVLEAQKYLASKGFAVAAIRPPTVAEGSARLRISLSASHTEEEIQRLMETLASLLVQSGSES